MYPRSWDDRDPKHPHLTPHALLIPRDFLLRNGLLCELARDVPRRRLAEGFRVAAKESGVAGSVLGVALEEAWMGGLRDAHRESTVLVVRAVSRAAICDDHDVGFVIYLQYRFRVHTPERPSHVP